jgi:hypothetical protein
MFIYVTSLILMQGVTVEAQHNSLEWVALDEEAKEQILWLYGDIGSAMLTLFWTISGGMEWSVPSELLARLDVSLSVVWLIFIAFIMFGLLNVMVAIFVESAMQAIPFETRKSFSEGVAAIFRLADKDQDGYLNKDEFRTLLMDPYLITAIDELGIMKEVSALTESLDIDKRGQISLEEFESTLWHSVEGDHTALNMLMTLHESHFTSTKIRATLDSFQQRQLMGSNLKACLATPDGNTRQMAVSDVGPVQSEPWLAAWKIQPDSFHRSFDG